MKSVLPNSLSNSQVSRLRGAEEKGGSEHWKWTCKQANLRSCCHFIFLGICWCIHPSYPDAQNSLALKCVNTRLRNGPLKQEFHCTWCMKEDDNSDTHLVFWHEDLCLSGFISYVDSVHPRKKNKSFFMLSSMTLLMLSDWNNLKNTITVLQIQMENGT